MRSRRRRQRIIFLFLWGWNSIIRKGKRPTQCSCERITAWIPFEKNKVSHYYLTFSGRKAVRPLVSLFHHLYNHRKEVSRKRAALCILIKKILCRDYFQIIFAVLLVAMKWMIVNDEKTDGCGETRWPTNRNSSRNQQREKEREIIIQDKRFYQPHISLKYY